MNTDDFVNDLREHGVAYTDLNDRFPTAGYLVCLAGSDQEYGDSRSFDESDLLEYLALYTPLLYVGSNTHLLGYVAPDGAVMLYVAAHFGTASDAQEAALAAGMLVYYNVSEDIFEAAV